MQWRFLIFYLVLFLIGVYLVRKAGQAPARWRTPARIGVLITLIVAVSWQLLYRQGILSPQIAQPYLWVGSTLFGALASYLIFSLFWDTSRAVLWLSAKISVRLRAKHAAAVPLDRDRRAFLQNSATLGLLGVSGVTSSIGLRQALAGPKVKGVNVPVEGLHPDLRNLRIAQISDLHIGPTIQRDYVEAVVRAVRALEPDLIAVTGDLADGTPAELRPHSEPLAGLRAPLGVYYVTGNHEYYWGGSSWITEVQRLGMTALENEHRLIIKGGARLLIGGVPDPTSARMGLGAGPQPERAMAQNIAADFRILLNHRPLQYDEAERAGAQLQLSGHTHAGQFYPWAVFIPFVYDYYRGLNRHRRLWLYVNQGTGYWGPPNRFAVPCEITLLTLQAGS